MRFEYIFNTELGRVVVPAGTQEEANEIIATSKKYAKAKSAGKQLATTKTDFPL